MLAAATARGLVGLHLVAGAASPSWHEAAPQCICEGVEIRAVRSQVGPAGVGRWAAAASIRQPHALPALQAVMAWQTAAS